MSETASSKPGRPPSVKEGVMHRFARIATLASVALAAQFARAQTAHNAPSATAATGSPLATGLEALRTSDYARAIQTLSAIHGADAPAAQVALSRAMIRTGRYDIAEQTAKQVGGTAAERLAAIPVRAEALFRVGKVADAIKLLEANAGGTGVGARRVRLLLGEYRIASGHRADADDPLMKIVEEYNDGTIANTDAEGLGDRRARGLLAARARRTPIEPSTRASAAGRTLGDAALARRAVPREGGHGSRGRGPGRGARQSLRTTRSCSSRWRARRSRTRSISTRAEKLVANALAINPKLVRRLRNPRGARAPRHETSRGPTPP